MALPAIDPAALRRALAMLRDACDFRAAEPGDSPLKPHLRSAVVQSFEFSDESSMRLLRRVLIERSASARGLRAVNESATRSVAETTPLVVANARRRPSDGCALRRDRRRFRPLLGRAGSIHSF